MERLGRSAPSDSEFYGVDSSCHCVLEIHMAELGRGTACSQRAMPERAQGLTVRALQECNGVTQCSGPAALRRAASQGRSGRVASQEVESARCRSCAKPQQQATSDTWPRPVRLHVHGARRRRGRDSRMRRSGSGPRRRVLLSARGARREALLSGRGAAQRAGRAVGFGRRRPPPRTRNLLRTASTASASRWDRAPLRCIFSSDICGG